MAEALRDGSDGNPGRQHLARHEMAEVVQPEMRQAGSTSRRNEPLGQPVGSQGFEPSARRLNTNARWAAPHHPPGPGPRHPNDEP